MSIIQPEKLYYHTSYKVIEEIDLSQGKPGSDFGRGFYLTSSKEQAERFAADSVKRPLFGSSVI